MQDKTKSRCAICGGDHQSILCPVRLGIFGEGKMVHRDDKRCEETVPQA